MKRGRMFVFHNDVDVNTYFVIMIMVKFDFRLYCVILRSVLEHPFIMLDVVLWFLTITF